MKLICRLFSHITRNITFYQTKILINRTVAKVNCAIKQITANEEALNAESLFSSTINFIVNQRNLNITLNIKFCRFLILQWCTKYSGPLKIEEARILCEFAFFISLQFYSFTKRTVFTSKALIGMRKLPFSTGISSFTFSSISQRYAL